MYFTTKIVDRIYCFLNSKFTLSDSKTYTVSIFITCMGCNPGSIQPSQPTTTRRWSYFFWCLSISKVKVWKRIKVLNQKQSNVAPPTPWSSAPDLLWIHATFPFFRWQQYVQEASNSDTTSYNNSVQKKRCLFSIIKTPWKKTKKKNAAPSFILKESRG